MNNNFLTHKIPVEYLLAIKDGTYIHQIHRKINMIGVYSMYKIQRVFEENGLIRTEKKGRTRYIYLTEKGKLIQEELFKLKEDLKW